MQNILADLTHHAERFQAHVETAKSSEASQQDRENAFFNAQIHWAGIQHKFQEMSHHVGLEFIDIMKGFGMDWFKENMKPNENPDAVKKEYVDTPATPETSEPVQAVPQPQFLGDVPAQVEVPPQEATPTTQEPAVVQQTTS